MKPKEIKTITAAYLFSKGKTASEISEIMALSERQIYRYATFEEWHQTLDRLGYTGDRSLRKAKPRDAKRDAGSQYDIAKAAYESLRSEGNSKASLARLTSEATGITATRIRDWARKHHW